MSRPYAIDQNTTLCLTCSCSLPPFRALAAAPPSSSEPQWKNTVDPREEFTDYLEKQGHHITPCCKKPICPSCVKSNPRLARYDPCLSCLAGVDAVGYQSPRSVGSRGFSDVKNIDGAMKDEDTFVVGEDDEAVDEFDLPPPDYYASEVGGGTLPSGVSPGETTEQQKSKESLDQTLEVEGEEGLPENSEKRPLGSRKYYLEKKDTLQGLALRFGVDGRELCWLNNLPMSTLTTTPNILHARSFIVLPPSSKPHDQEGPSEEELKAREAKRVRERAERKLQTLMKEADWRVAKAYVALADDEEQQDEARRKMKMSDSLGSGSSANALEAAAIEQYLDDEKWEREQRKQGLGPLSPATCIPFSRDK